MESIVQDAVKAFQGTVLRERRNTAEYPLLEVLGTSVKEEVKNCDGVFCEYLAQVGKVVNSDYFLTVAKFIVLYRECVNRYGWAKFGDRVKPDTEESQPKEYTAAGHVEFIPELANELVLSYLPECNYPIAVADCTSLAVNFCAWLFNSGYTCLKIVSVKK
eukprot:TRINITY_DN2746_c0_g2_i1.p1 TRINITY_DN2746_c0_g2~~TRINITY_DN2746_c0_g2_i1.p1  ORF type:complete len:161 (+),score=36.35 TRINITY_DN2746_c0_g2_i1:499-981(+)